MTGTCEDGKAQGRCRIRRGLSTQGGWLGSRQELRRGRLVGGGGRGGGCLTSLAAAAMGPRARSRGGEGPFQRRWDDKERYIPASPALFFWAPSWSAVLKCRPEEELLHKT